MHKRVGIAVGILVVIGAGIALAFSLHGKSAADACQATAGQNYHVVITNGKASNDNLRAHMCDTLTFTNKDAIAREIAFGPHEHHVPYDGVAERVLNKNQSFTVTLNQTGNFRWHDHLHDEVEGTFAVTR